MPVTCPYKCIQSLTCSCYSLIALQSGGATHPWSSAYVLATLFVGFFLLVGFVVWEVKFARYPMMPKELFRGQNIVAMAFVVSFVSGKYGQARSHVQPAKELDILDCIDADHFVPTGMNFSALLNFFPLEFTAVFVPDPIQIGLKDLPAALLLIGGSIASNAALAYLKGHNRVLMLVGCVIMSESRLALQICLSKSPPLSPP